MVLSSRSGLLCGHVFLKQPARLSSCWEGRKPEPAGWLGTYCPDSGPGVHPLHPVACLLQRKPCFQGQGSLEVLSLRSGVFGGLVFKVVMSSCSSLQGCPHAGMGGCRNWQCCLGLAALTQV